MQVVIDIEANSLINPTKIWLIVCKDILTGDYHIFRNLHEGTSEADKFRTYAADVDCWIGHNAVGYDLPVVVDILGDIPNFELDRWVDTLIISKLVDYSRSGHSVEDYGEEFGQEKIKFNDWTKWSQEMETYCIRDVDITHRIYLKYLKVIKDAKWQPSIRMEHDFQLVVNELHRNGFAFNTKKAESLLEKVSKELSELDQKILTEFPPKLKYIREVTPKITKHGTISRTSIPRALGDDMSPYSEGASFSYCKWEEFNPSSHKQIIQILNDAGWVPVDKTKTHIDTEREINRLKYVSNRSNELDITLQAAILKYNELTKVGWKVNEKNLDTLPPSAPSPARLLAKRILLESRRRTLTEWLGLVDPDTNRIHGKFYGIGAWTHRMAHQQPNTANIPNEFALNGEVKLLGKEMRQLWQAPRNRLLVGVDAEAIQLRIFAHYIDEPEFTKAIVGGKKNDKSDPHSFNQRVLGSVCKSRAAAKRFIFALLLGAGIGKLAEILECSIPEAQEALDRLMSKYSGFAALKREIIPRDAKKGWFEGLDHRKVAIPGETVGSRKHLAMSGYLQNGEAVCMKMATLLWRNQLNSDKEIFRLYKTGYLLVNFVHDEWQVEVPNNMEVAKQVAEILANSLKIVGEELGLKCPLAGSYWNDDHEKYTIDTNWYGTH